MEFLVGTLGIITEATDGGGDGFRTYPTETDQPFIDELKVAGVINWDKKGKEYRLYKPGAKKSRVTHGGLKRKPLTDSGAGLDSSRAPKRD